MARAYPDDLRRKFAEAYERGDASLSMLAARFGVSVGWAEKLRRTQHQTGRIERPVGAKHGPQSKLTDELREQIAAGFGPGRTGHWSIYSFSLGSSTRSKSASRVCGRFSGK